MDDLPYSRYVRVALLNDLDPLPADNPLTGKMITYGHDEEHAGLAAAGWLFRQPLTPYAIKVMRNIKRGRYFRRTGGYRSLPVMGKPMPMILMKTARPLLIGRYIRQDNHGCLWLTEKGHRNASS